MATIIDNTDSGFSTVGSWNTYVLGSNYFYGPNYAYSGAGTGADVATWTFSGLVAGTYRISATWATNGSHAPNAQYKIYDGLNLLLTVQIDQRVTPSQDVLDTKWFEDLSTGLLVGSGTLKVEIDDNTSGTVIADAIRVELISTPLPALPTISIDSANGNDTFASGAGPSTPITSTSASTDVGGFVVTMPNADFSGVAVDGSHLLYISGEGVRRIASVADSGLSTASVTVAYPFTGSLTGQTAAIGGSRQYLFGSTQSEIESSVAAGWTISLAPGHSETHNGSAITFNVGDTRQEPLRIIGDANNKATFISVVNAFVRHFDFSSCHGLVVKNCNFEAYRGTDVNGTGSVDAVIRIGENQVYQDCQLLARAVYSSAAYGSGGGYGNGTSFIGCVIRLTDDSTQKYGVHGGLAGRSLNVINCKIIYFGRAVSTQTFGGYQSNIIGCQIDCREGLYGDGSGVYHYGHTFCNNIIKVQDGGKGITLGLYLWGYRNAGKLIHANNIIFTDDGGHTLSVEDPETLATDLVSNTYFINNVQKNPSYDPRIPQDQVINEMVVDPQITGDLTTGNFVVGNKAAIEHVNVAPGTTGNRPNQAGTQIYPFRHLVEDFFEVHEDATVDAASNRNFHPLG